MSQMKCLNKPDSKVSITLGSFAPVVVKIGTKKLFTYFFGHFKIWTAPVYQPESKDKSTKGRDILHLTCTNLIKGLLLEPKYIHYWHWDYKGYTIDTLVVEIGTKNIIWLFLGHFYLDLDISITLCPIWFSKVSN